MRRCKDVGIQHVPRVTTTLDVRSPLRERVHDLYDLVPDIRHYYVGVRERAYQMSALSEVGRMRAGRGANDACAMQNGLECTHKVIEWSVGQTCWWHFLEVGGYSKRQFQIVEYSLHEVARRWEAALEGVFLCADQAAKDTWIHTVYGIPRCDVLNASG